MNLLLNIAALAAFFLINSKAGLVLAVLVLAALLLRANWATRCSVLFMYGMYIAGFVTIVYGLPGWGGKIVLALVAPIYFYLNRKKDINPSYLTGLTYLFFIILVFYVFYLLGPQNEFCQGKYVSIITTLILSYLSFIVLIDSKSLNYDQLGQLFIVSSLFCFVFAVKYIYGSFGGIAYGLGSLRSTATELKGYTDVRLSYQFLGPITSIGVAAYLQSVDNIKSLVHRLPLIFCGIAIILISGGRQNIVMLLVGLMMLYYCNIRGVNKERHAHYSLRFLIIILIFSIPFFIVQSYQATEIPFLRQVFEAQSFTEAINRAGNFESAFILIKENLFFGTGLGGYYVIGSAGPASIPGAAYPHNIFLELLCETGVVGTLVLLFPIFIYWRKGKLPLNLKSARSGLFLLPFFSILFVRYSISAGLSSSVELFAFIAAYVSVKHYAQQPVQCNQSLQKSEVIGVQKDQCPTPLCQDSCRMV
ncbi:MAG: O-antigen ligase family protein [Syntrophales bacterium]|jgi:O-antigen ligase|nr:O-antigen ligase family protein [Syntrophales bacterium]